MKVDIKLDVDVSMNNEEIEDISFASIVDAVCDKMKIPIELFMSKSRPAYLSEARFVAYYLGWMDTNRSLPSIGKFMGKDHTTVIHGRNRCMELMRSRDGFRNTVEEIRKLAGEYERERKRQAEKKMHEVRREVERASRKASIKFTKQGKLRGDEVIFHRINT